MRKFKTIGGNRIILRLKEIVLSKAIDDKKTSKSEPDFEIYYYEIFLVNGRLKIGEISAKLGMNDYFYYIGNVGFYIDEAYRGNGYAGEAVMLLKNLFLAHNMKSIIITNDPKNKSSMRVCEKLGAKLKEVVKVPDDHILKTKHGNDYENIWILDFKK